MIHIMQLVGIEDNDKIMLMYDSGSPQDIQYYVPNTIPLLHFLDPKRYEVRKLMVGGIKSDRVTLSKPDLIYNSTCDPDSSQKALVASEQIISLLKAPVINPPSAVQKTSRDYLYNMLKGRDDLIIPKTIRFRPLCLEDIRRMIDKEAIGFPFIFRPLGEHGEVSYKKIDTLDVLHELECFAFDGREYYMTEFIDYRSPDKLYRKYRFFLIDGKVVPGHLIVSGNWNIHHDSQEKSLSIRKMDEIKSEEKAFLKNYRKKRISGFETLYENIGLDYFGIDCAFDKKGRPIVFEINSCMHHLSKEKEKGYYSSKQLSYINGLIEQMVQKKLQKGRENG
ncbi:MAG: hypothetical protein P794_05940 [Epsilonproteobacteria bacterium (ex Lamellibrachia satsuma)]|nr:MAG: hypothetical protein P794_05940 [Epsilonproteobacteria bacterium (ex Lamellibrachia satsuma)]